MIPQPSPIPTRTAEAGEVMNRFTLPNLVFCAWQPHVLCLAASCSVPGSLMYCAMWQPHVLCLAASCTVPGNLVYCVLCPAASCTVPGSLVYCAWQPRVLCHVAASCTVPCGSLVYFARSSRGRRPSARLAGGREARVLRPVINRPAPRPDQPALHDAGCVPD